MLFIFETKQFLKNKKIFAVFKIKLKYSLKFFCLFTSRFKVKQAELVAKVLQHSLMSQ